MKTVKKDLPRDASYVFPVNILDGGALLRKIKWIPNSTVHDVILQSSCIGYALLYLMDMMGNQVTKDLGYQRHLRNTSTYVKVDLENQISCSKKEFLEVKQNLMN